MTTTELRPKLIRAMAIRNSVKRRNDALGTPSVTLLAWASLLAIPPSGMKAMGSVEISMTPAATKNSAPCANPQPGK